MSRVAVIHEGADCFAIEKFSRGAGGAGVVSGAQIFYGVDGRACSAGADWAYPLWEHRIFDGGHFMKG